MTKNLVRPLDDAEKQRIAEYKERERQQTHKWLSEKFGIPVEDIVWYNSGICYSRIVVKTQESADKVTAKVKGQTVNGGWFHGMSLGGQTQTTDEKTGEKHWDVTC